MTDSGTDTSNATPALLQAATPTAPINAAAVQETTSPGYSGYGLQAMVSRFSGTWVVMPYNQEAHDVNNQSLVFGDGELWKVQYCS